MAINHIHHIIPKHVTGGVANNHPDNLITLTIEEHAEFHKQRWLMERDWQDEVAYLALSGSITNSEAHIIAVSITAKKFMKGRKHALGTHHKKSEYAKLKIKERMKGKCFKKNTKHSKETKQKLSNSLKGNRNNLGKILSKETRQKIREAAMVRVSCIYCHKEFFRTSLYRHQKYNLGCNK